MLSSQLKPFKNADGPKCEKSMIKRHDPKRLIPYTNEVDPHRRNVCEKNEIPIFMKSRTGGELSDQPQTPRSLMRSPDSHSNLFV